MSSRPTRHALVPLAIFAAAAAMPAVAGDPARCTSIADDGARLACYDAALRAREPPLPAPAPAAESDTKPATRAAGEHAAGDERSMIGERWSRYEPTPGHAFLVRLHNANYLMLRHSDRVDATPASPAHGNVDDAGIERDELKFQVSFKARLWESRDHFYAAWLGYTQQSNWQALNAAQSRPFRESNYAPELMFVMLPDAPLPGGFRWQLLNLGALHQSNGRSDPASRSWNRLYAQLGVENDHVAGGKLAVLVRPWLRLHESGGRDDNPDIADFMGYGDVVVLWRHDQQTLTFTGRLNARTGKGAAQIEWSAPAVGPFRFYLQAFTGYGESLIDYNFRQTVIGAGFALNDLL